MLSDAISPEFKALSRCDGHDNSGKPPASSRADGAKETVAVLNPQLSIGPLDVRSRSDKFILSLGGERQYEVSSLVCQIIRLIDGRRTDDEIADCLRKLNIADLSGVAVREIIDRYFVPNGFVTSLHGLDGQKNHGISIRIKFPVFSQEQLRPVTNLLFILFSGQIFILLFTVSALAQLYLAPTLGIDFRTTADVAGFQLVLVYFMVVLTSFIHELGHSSACTYFGARHGEIGLGIYLFFPVL